MSLQPTLWRTCRVLANERRLDCLKVVLSAKQDVCVDDVAQRIGLSFDKASLCLRALQARGLLKATRQSRWVYYSPVPDPSVPIASPVLMAVRAALLDEKWTDEKMMRTVTAFTHPRRLTILQTLLHSHAPIGACRLSVLTQVSLPALERHLRKLRDRDMIRLEDDGWRMESRQSSLARAFLTILAVG